MTSMQWRHWSSQCMRGVLSNDGAFILNALLNLNHSRELHMGNLTHLQGEVPSWTWETNIEIQTQLHISKAENEPGDQTREHTRVDSRNEKKTNGLSQLATKLQTIAYYHNCYFKYSKFSTGGLEAASHDSQGVAS